MTEETPNVVMSGPIGIITMTSIRVSAILILSSLLIQDYETTVAWPKGQPVTLRGHGREEGQNCSGGDKC